MKNAILLCLTILSTLYNVKGQTSITAEAKYSPMKVGDKMPVYVLKNLINYPNTTAPLSDFSGKLVILDFWSTRCSSCIESWPKLLELQKQFEGKIQIVLVNTTQNESTVRSLIDKRRVRANVNMTLPAVCGDTTLGNQLFKHRYEPHLVWIDREGHVKAITAGDQLNVKNVQAVIDEKDVQLKLKDDVQMKVDFRKPLFINENGGNGDHLLWYSLISNYFDGLYGTSILSADEKRGYSILVSNGSVVGMLRYLSGEGDDEYGFANWLASSRISLRVKDPERFAEKLEGSTQYQNYYTYQLISKKPTTKEKLKNFMLSDLERYFDFKTHWEKRKMKCLVMTAADTAMIRYKGTGTWRVNDVMVELNNVTLDYFIKLLYNTTQYHNSPYPLINETNYKGKVGGISFETNVMDHKSLDDALSKYKIGFRLEERLIDVLVVEDN